MDTMQPSIVSNRYRFINEIGKGAMGVVSKVQDRLSGDFLALKQVTVQAHQLDFATVQDTQNVRFALAREFKVLSSLRHPHIISVLDYGFDTERRPFFTMELIENRQTLITYSQNRTLQEKCELILQILQALVYLHRREIIHRDLKPDNVMVVDGNAKMLDFGLAIARENIKENAGIAGTIAYMAPELLHNQGATTLTDLYAVGVMAYELFANQHPFDTTSIHKLLNDILHTQVDIWSVDVSAELQQFLGRLLDKDPKNRYQSAQEAIRALIAASDIQTAYEPPSIRESYLQSARFVGRQTELNTLTTALIQARNGKGNAWLIGGESGVGKSRLMEELRTFALVNDLIVLRGQGVANVGLPYQLWREVIRYLLLLTDDISDVDLAILRDIVPDIETLMQRNLPELAVMTGQESQQRINGVVSDLFKAVKRPILLIMEDLQWAYESLEPLRPLINMIESLPIMFVGTFRNDERPGLPDELPETQHVMLQRFDMRDVEKLSAAILGREAAVPHVTQFLHEQTEGNTLFLIEIIRELAQEVNELSEIAHTTLPETVFTGGVQQVIQRRLTRVPEEAKPLLYLAATIGREIDLQLLLHLEPQVAIDQWLNQCEEASVLEVQDERWRFAHDKIREVLLNDQALDVRSRNHRRIAQAIEVLYDDLTDQSVVLAYHWRHAGNVKKEIHYAIIAGEYQLRRSLYAEAMWFFSRALQIMPDQRFNQRERTRLTMLLGEAYLGVADYDRARALFEEAYKTAETLKNATLLAELLQRIGILNVKQGNYTTAEEVFHQSIAHARQSGDRLDLARSLGHLGEVMINVGQYNKAQVLLEESLDITQELNDPATSTLTLRSLGKMKYQQDNIDGGRVHIRKAMEIAHAIGDRYGVARAVNALGVFAATQGDYKSARIHYQEAVNIFSQIGDRWGEAVIKNNLAFVSMLDNDIKHAAPLFYAAITELRSISVIPVMLESMVGLARILVAAKRYEQAAEILGLAFNHPAKIEDVDTLAQYAADALQAACDEQDIRNWMAKGKDRDLDEVIAEIIVGREAVLNQIVIIFTEGQNQQR